MSGLILPPLAMPLFASLKRKSGHLTRNTSGTRHLAKCGDSPPPTCCDKGATTPPLTATFSGGTDCNVHMNGTFALTPNGTCTWSYLGNVLDPWPDLPADPCAGACRVQVFGGETRYWHLAYIYVDVVLSNSGQLITAQVNAVYGYYYMNFGTCQVKPFAQETVWAKFQRDTCDSGALTPVGSSAGTDAYGDKPYSCSIAF